MIYRYYSVFDRKALVYMPPFHALTDGAAIRAIMDAMADVNTSIHRHPSDFVLFFVGEYSDNKGEFYPASPLVHVVDVSSLAATAARSTATSEA